MNIFIYDHDLTSLYIPHAPVVGPHCDSRGAMCRHMPPNYYYDLEDTVERRVKDGAKWTYSSLRSPIIVGLAREAP